MSGCTCRSRRLSLTIKALEESLGGRLFSRTTRNVALTPEGESLLPLARRLIADWDNAEDEMRQRFTLQRGRVTLAAMPSFAGNLLPPILKTFRARYPKVNVTVNDVINEQVLEMVRDRQRWNWAWRSSQCRVHRCSSLRSTSTVLSRWYRVIRHWPASAKSTGTPCWSSPSLPCSARRQCG